MSYRSDNWRTGNYVSIVLSYSGIIDAVRSKYCHSDGNGKNKTKTEIAAKNGSRMRAAACDENALYPFCYPLGVPMSAPFTGLWNSQAHRRFDCKARLPYGLISYGFAPVFALKV